LTIVQIDNTGLIGSSLHINASISLSSINIPNDSASSPDTVAISGTGTLGSLMSSTLLVDFTNVPVGVLAGPSTVTISNNDAANSVTLGNLQQVGTDTDKFFISSDGCSNQALAPLGTCDFDVSFQTSEVGNSFSDSVLVPNNTATPNFTVALSGDTVQPNQQLRGSS